MTHSSRPHCSHNIVAVDWRVAPHREGKVGRLQWGHGREAMGEGRIRISSASTVIFNVPRPRGRGWVQCQTSAAGTGGLQRGHGREAVDGRRARSSGYACQSFNGATALPWRGHNSRPVPSGKNSFNGATALPWKADPLEAEIATLPRLQRGHGREAVDGRARRSGWPGPSASTGPRPRGRGWAACRSRCSFWLTGFNGATAARPWMAPCPPAPAAPPPSFNWATAARPRMGVRRRHSGPDRRASIGPRPRGRGWAVHGAVRARLEGASMGPRPRGRGWARRGRGRAHRRGASMGPRPRGRGWSPGVQPADFEWRLQWGHGREAVDGRSSPPQRA